MPDAIIEELWEIKDSIAREHGNDVRKLAAYLRRSYPEDVFISPERSSVESKVSADMTPRKLS